MNKDEKKTATDGILIPQEAPVKNTDHAFVQVGQDGSPQLPGEHDRDRAQTTDSETPKGS